LDSRKFFFKSCHYLYHWERGWERKEKRGWEGEAKRGSKKPEYARERYREVGERKE